MKKLIPLFLLLLPAAFFSFGNSCGTEDPGENGDGTLCNQCSSESSDDVKNSSSSVVTGYDYLDLVQGYSVSIGGTTVTCVIKVEDIPDSGELTFNHSALGDGYLEYEWSVSFDVDNDGTDDYSLAVLHFKFGGSTETTGLISDYTQENLWKNTGTSWISLTNAILTLDAIADTFTIEATHAEVSTITSSADKHVGAFMNDGSAGAPYTDCCID